MTTRITKHEYQILEEYALGAKGPQVAQNLGISPQTVKNHLANLRKRAGAKTTFELMYRFANGEFEEWYTN